MVRFGPAKKHMLISLPLVHLTSVSVFVCRPSTLDGCGRRTKFGTAVVGTMGLVLGGDVNRPMVEPSLGVTTIALSEQNALSRSCVLWISPRPAKARRYLSILQLQYRSDGGEHGQRASAGDTKHTYPAGPGVWIPRTSSSLSGSMPTKRFHLV